MIGSLQSSFGECPWAAGTEILEIPAACLVRDQGQINHLVKPHLSFSLQFTILAAMHV